MKYDYHVSLHRRKRFIKRAYITVVVILLLIIAVGVAIRVDTFLEKDRNTEESTTSSQTTGYFAPTTQIFRTQYFQIQTNKNWAEVPSESTANKFVYRSLRGNLVEHDMTIYVNDIPGDIAATRVLPVALINSASEIKSETVSDHCNGGTEDLSASDQTRIVDKVSMLCDLDNTQYHVLVGQAEGDTVLRMKRPDGSLADYTILYRNVTAKPEASQLYEIISSFQTR